MGISLGLMVEIAVAILLALTIGYCIVLNQRLKSLHADREAMSAMVADLVGATTLAERAIKELKQTALEADETLSARLEAAERFGVELASQLSAGTVLMERIAMITSAARKGSAEPEPVEDEAVPRIGKAQSALRRLSERVRERGSAA